MMNTDALTQSIAEMSRKAMNRITDIPPERVGLGKALRKAYRVPANDVPGDWQHLLEQMR